MKVKQYKNVNIVNFGYYGKTKKENLPCIWHTNFIWQKPVGERAPNPDEYCHKSVNERNSVKCVLSCDPCGSEQRKFHGNEPVGISKRTFAKLFFDKYKILRWNSPCKLIGGSKGC